MKLFGKPIQELFKSRTDIIKEQFGQPIKTIDDIDEFYRELGDYEDMNAEDLNDMLSSKDLEDFAATPGKNHRSLEAQAIRNIAAEEDFYTRHLDDQGLDFIIGKKGWIDPEVDDSPAPIIENENENLSYDELGQRDQKRHRNISKKIQEKLKQPRQESVPVDLPLENVQEVEMVEEKVDRVKPEVKINLEQKEKDTTELDRFKFMKEVLTYKKLVKENPDIKNLRPKRGPDQLSAEQIAEEIKKYETRVENREETSPLETKFYEQCKAWTRAVKDIEKFKNNEPKNPDGTILSDADMKKLQDEYFAMQQQNPEKFAKMVLEVYGESQVEAGKWKKGSFAWTYSNFKNRDQWVATKPENGMSVFYVTGIDPTEVAPEGQSAEYFYVVKSELPNRLDKKKKTVFIDVMLPRVDKTQGKKVSA